MNKNINSFNNLVFYPMSQPNVGCIATGKLASGYNITVTGGNHGQKADGVDTYLVEVSEPTGKGDQPPRVVTKRNVDTDGLRSIIEQHYRNRNRTFRRRKHTNVRKS